MLVAGKRGCAAHQLISGSKGNREAAVVVKWRWVRKKVWRNREKRLQEPKE